MVMQPGNAVILYHASAYENLNPILSDGMKVTSVPEHLAGIVPAKTGVYLGERHVVGSVVEGLFLFEGVDRVAIFSVHLNDTDVAKLIPDPEMEDEETPNVYHAWIYPECIPVEKIQLDGVEHV